MSQESTTHTIETLEALPRKADVIAIAEELKLDTEGTRAELTDRILDALAAPAEGTADEGISEETDPERSRAEDGTFTADNPGTAPNEAYTPPLPGKLSDTARLAVEQIVASFLGAEEAVPEIAGIVTAIEEGKQPCVVEGNGNTRFAVRVFDELFDCNDCTRDIAPGRDGVSVNLARMLDSKNLFPRG